MAKIARIKVMNFMLISPYTWKSFIIKYKMYENIQFQISVNHQIHVYIVNKQLYKCVAQSSANFIHLQTLQKELGMIYDEQNETQAQIKEKRYKFYLDIRQKSRDQIINTMRYRIRKQQDNQKLNKLIQTSQLFVQYHQFLSLVDFARRGNHNAVIHIGNMLLQKKINEQIVRQVGISWISQIDASSGYYQWLLMIIFASGLADNDWVYHTQKMIDLIIQTKIIDQFRILYCLKCLNFICKFDHPKEGLTNLSINNNFCCKIMKLASNKSKQIVRLSWRLANHLFNQNNNSVAVRFLFSYGISAFFQLIQIGFNSIDAYVRILACQIFCNNVEILNGIANFHTQQLINHKLDERYFSSLMDNILSKSLNLTLSKYEDFKVKVQMSYIFANYIGSCNLTQMVQLIDKGLLDALNVFQLQFNSNIQVKQNISLICERLKKLLFQIQDAGDNQLKRIIQILQHADILQDEQQFS